MNLTDLFRDDTPSAGSSLGLGTIAKFAVPMILMGLLNNVHNEKKAASLAKALKDHEEDQLDIRYADTEDGKKILGHIFGENKNVITEAIARQNNISTSEADDVLGKLAPVILGKMAKETKEERSLQKMKEAALKEIRNVQEDKSAPDLGDLLGGMLGGGSSGGAGNITDIFGDLLGGAAKTQRKQQGSGLEDILGDLLGGGGGQKDPGLLESVLGGLLKK